MAQYAEHRRPARIERHIGEYFTDWLRGAQEAARMKRGGEEASAGFGGFGKSGAEDVEAWEQWYAHVLWVNEGSPDGESDG